MIRTQRYRDPEKVFGDIPVMVLEEVFEGQAGASKKLRHRSSSAAWSGVDQLTEQEDKKYKKRMGFL